MEAIMPVNESVPNIQEMVGKRATDCFVLTPESLCSAGLSLFANAINLSPMGTINPAPTDYSSITYSNMSTETLRKITSKAAIKPNQGGSFTDGTTNVPVARTAPMTTGTIKGKTSIGNNNSRARVAAAIAENKVPIVAMPSVPSKTIGSSAPLNNGILNRAAKTGSATTSTTPINSILPRSFAR